MKIPNVKKFRIIGPDGMTATIMAVLPKGTDREAYLKDAAERFDWTAHKQALAAQFKVRVGQQKQKKAK